MLDNLTCLLRFLYAGQEATEPDLEQWTGWKLGKEYVKAVYCCCCCCVTSIVSDSVRPHRRQPTRLCCPWDSPGKNSGVSCHFLLQCMKVKSESEVAQSCPTQRPHGLQPTRLLHPWDFPGTSTGVECHCYPAYLTSMQSSVQFSSVAQSCPTFCDPMGCSMPGLPVHHQLPEFTQTHVLWVDDAIQPSHPLSSPSPPTFDLS